MFYYQQPWGRATKVLVSPQDLCYQELGSFSSHFVSNRPTDQLSLVHQTIAA